MDKFEVFSVDSRQINEVEKLFPEDVVRALKEKMPVTALIAVVDDKAVGSLSGAINENTFIIDSIYVAPDFRRQGAGGALIKALIKILAEADLNMDISLRADFTELSAEDETLRPFFASTGFIEDSAEYPVYYLSEVGDMADSDDMSKDGKPYQITRFADVPEEILMTEEARLKELGAPMPEHGFDLNLKSEVSSFCILDGNNIDAYLIVEPVGADMLMISALWSDFLDPRPMMSMIGTACDDIRERYDPDTQVVSLVLHPVAEKMFRHVFPKAEICSYSFAR